MMKLKHRSHDHELVLCMVEKHEDVAVSCDGCRQLISGLVYVCGQCAFYLHKSCATLPREIIHPLHSPSHLLTLIPYSNTICDICQQVSNQFMYYCNLCSFDVDITCVMNVLNITKMIKHRNHQHKLMPIMSPTTFLCYACGTKHESDTSYICPTCGFLVSQKCASLPTKLKCSHHPHSDLTLLHSIYEGKGRQWRRNCNICDSTVDRLYWVYHCLDCRYTVHVHCVASEAKQYSIDCETEIELEHLDRDKINYNSAFVGIATPNAELLKKLINLPSDKSIDLIMTKFMESTIEKNHNEVNQFTHVSHDHPLRSVTNLIISDEKCNGCTQSISSAPFYECTSDQCDFFLHEYCTRLPTEVLQHPCHPQHPLQLTQKIERYKCGCCLLNHNAFSFGCHGCKFFLDIKCASLPRIVKHVSHKHILTLRKLRSQCSSCDCFLRVGFRCDGCKINLCIRCILVPPSVIHRYDEHEFTLNYGHQAAAIKDAEAVQVEVQVEEDYCLICEEEIDFKFWFYHCGPCDRSLHTECVLPIDFGEDLDVKYGADVEIEDHSHPVKIVRIPRDNSKCHRCGKPFRRYYNMAYECEPCKFWIHPHCFEVLEEPQDIIRKSSLILWRFLARRRILNLRRARQMARNRISELDEGEGSMGARSERDG